YFKEENSIERVSSCCVDAIDGPNISSRRNVCVGGEGLPRRFGDCGRDSLFTSNEHEPFPPLLVPRRRKVAAATDQRQLGTRQRSDFRARWWNDCVHPRETK